MKPQERARSFVRFATLVIGLALPTLSLVPLGSLWLWEHGYLLHWALAVAVIVTGTFLWQRRVLAPQPTASGSVVRDPPPEDADIDVADPAWTPLEQLAWQDVVAIARNINPERLASREAAVEAAGQTIRAVARRLHPEVAEPVWQFTVPEALAIVERVSRRLGRFFVGHVPFSDRLTVARALSMYRWRGTLEVAEKAYDVWRVIRLANPLAAATHEVRERMSRQMLQWGRDHIARQLAEAYIKEVGRAAIDLYGGRLRIAAAHLDSHVTAVSRRDLEQARANTAEPLRLLVTGQKGAGKSSLILALAGEVRAAVGPLPRDPSEARAYEVRKAQFPPALVIDSPAAGTTEAELKALTARAADCDLVLWVVSALASDRLADRKAIAAVRAYFTGRRDRRPPPVLVVLTHIDGLPPAGEWQPPYDVADASRPKSAAIAARAREVGRELGQAEVVPVSLRREGAYNVDAVWSRMMAQLPEALAAQLARRLQDARSRWNLRQIGAQAVNAGRILVRSMQRR